MKRKRIVAETIETISNKNPEYIGLIAAEGEEQFEIVFETTSAPALAASIILASQDAVKSIDPESIEKHLDRSMEILPEAIGIELMADGDVLCINVGSGGLFFKLSAPAKRALNKPV